MKRKRRAGEVICRCGAYKWPHRMMGGRCDGGALVYKTFEEQAWGSCRDCHFRIDDDGHPVLRIGSSASEIMLKEYNDKIGFYDTSGTLLAYWNNNSFELVELSKFRLGPMGIVVQPNGSVSFVGVN
mgnify:CR=1 FL=1